MKSTAVILVLFFAVSLSGCTNRASVMPDPSASASPSEALKMPEPSRSPAGEIKSVGIDTAREWNDFARGYNGGESAYCDVLTVEINGRLDFEGMDFVPLYKPFNGTIRGTLSVEGYTEAAMRAAKLSVSSSGGGYGFFNIGSVEKTTGAPISVYSGQDGLSLQQIAQGSDAPRLTDYISGVAPGLGDTFKLAEASGMFGVRCETLTLETLIFENIRTDALCNLLSWSVDDLTMRNIQITNCAVRRTNALLACNAGRAIVENMLVLRCDTELETYGGGLFMWIYENASFKRVGAAYWDVLLIPDSAGSGYWAGDAALMASFVGGETSFERIELYHCSLYSLNSVVLCHSYGGLPLCTDITVQCSSFLGFPLTGAAMSGPPANRLLFGGSVPPAGARNVLLRDSMFNALGEFDDYPDYVIENCVSVAYEPGE